MAFGARFAYIPAMIRRFRTASAAAAATALFLLAACSGDDKEEYVERPVEEIYNDAVNAMSTEQYRRAARLFDEVERQHPYSVWATRAQLQGAYALYQVNRYDDAITRDTMERIFAFFAKAEPDAKDKKQDR